ncbi:alkaline phosphatase [Kangiella sp. HD9-110m-PIT-SAG07]|nr:alkaline phosphatase [Kangiella sp. HD9-110m-PIT-SAG07]
MEYSRIFFTVLLSVTLLSLASCQTTTDSEQLSLEQGIQLELVARHVSHQYGEGAAEIVAYDQSYKKLYVVNGASKAIDIIDISQLPTVPLRLPYSGNNLSSQQLFLPKSVSTAGAGMVKLGGPNSLAIHNDILAIAVATKNKQSSGAVLFYSLSDQTPSLIQSVSVGALPDMVAFTKDGSKAIVANEGEPSKDYHVDPEGSISIISMTPSIAHSAKHLRFTDFNSKRESLEKTGVKFASPEGTSVAQDLEPEYITVTDDGSRAYVSLQENNALAIVDLQNNTILGVKGLGFKDWGKYKIDVSNKDGVNAAYYENIFGLYQPDSITSYQVNSKTYILSANEGDAREYIYQTTEAECKAAGHKFDDEDGCISYTEEYRAKNLPIKSPSVIDSYYHKNGIGRLKVTNVLGDEDGDGLHEKLYSYGARSFSIWDQAGDLVFDSGDDFEQRLIERYGEQFNSNENENKGDSRSDDKGAEPEAITVGLVKGKVYAFIGLERHGGIMIYDVSNPLQPTFASYVNNRDFSKEFEIDDETDPVTLKGAYNQVGDLAPEGLVFIVAEESPTGKPLLAVANEVSGSVSIYQIE